MTIDQHSFMPIPSREMELHDVLPRPTLKQVKKIMRVVYRIRIEVRHVAKQPASGAIDHGAQELDLTHFATGHDHWRGDILEDQRRPDTRPHSFDVPHNDIDGLTRPREWGEMSDGYSARASERDVFAPPGRVHARNELSHCREVRVVDPFRASKR